MQFLEENRKSLRPRAWSEEFLDMTQSMIHNEKEKINWMKGKP